MTVAVTVDHLVANGTGFSGVGSVASKLLATNGDFNSMRPELDEEVTLEVLNREYAETGRPIMLGDALLRKDEWKRYDDTVIRVAQQKFTFLKDLMAAGLSYPIDNIMGVMGLSWERISETGEAQLDMSAEAEDEYDRLTYATDMIPIPLAHTGFSLDLRHLMASRTTGLSLDTEHAASCTRRVIEKLEMTAIKGAFSTGADNGGTLYGIMTYPYRNTGALSASWLTATPVQIFDDVNAIINTAELDGADGPYRLYIPLDFGHVLREDYNNAGSQIGKTIRNRLLEIEGLESIQTNRFIPSNNVVLVSMSSDTCEVIDGLRPGLIQWDSKGGMVQKYKVMACMPIRIKRDAQDQCGIVHYSV